jgi:hypothetical protein
MIILTIRGIDERRHAELADAPQHQRQVGHGTELLHRDCHEPPFCQSAQRVHHSPCCRDDIDWSPAGSKNPLTRPLPLERGAIFVKYL